MNTQWSSIRSTLATLSLATLVAVALPSAALAAKGGNGGGGKPGGGGNANPEVVYEKANHPGKMMEMDIDGANKSAVLDYRVQDPAWSADGTQFVYATENPARGIYKCDADGSGEVFLAPTITYVSNSPRWSPVAAPDGKFKIAFVDTLPNKSRKHVWLVNPDDGDLQILRPETAGTGSDTGPTWSPDGTRLAVRHYHQNDPDTVVIYTLGAASGGGLEVLGVDVLDFTDTELAGAEFHESAYARDSDRLVVSATPMGASLADLWIVPVAYDGGTLPRVADAGGTQQLTDTPDDHEVAPSWCGGDVDIVYLISNRSTIYKIDSVGGVARTMIGNSKKAEDEPSCKF